MEFDYSKLSGRIKEKFGSQLAFAKAMGWSAGKVSYILSGRNPISTQDVFAMCAEDRLDISKPEIPTYFFTLKLHKCE